MPANNTAIITAKSGPGISAVATTLTEVTGVNFDFAGGTFSVFRTAKPPSIFEFTDVATVSFSLSAGGPVTVTIST
jgi:cytidylate kinase